MDANPDLTREQIQKQQDEYKRRMEKMQTDRFIEGLRKAVRRHIAEREASAAAEPRMPKQPPPPLPHFPYNNTTRELAAIHGQPDYHETFPNTTIDDSPHHLAANLTHHAYCFQETYISNYTRSYSFGQARPKICLNRSPTLFLLGLTAAGLGRPGGS